MKYEELTHDLHREALKFFHGMTGKPHHELAKIAFELALSETAKRIHTQGMIEMPKTSRETKGYITIEEHNRVVHECILQFEYLNGKFGETGTTNAILAKLKSQQTK